MPQSKTFTHLGTRLNAKRSTRTTSTSQLAEMLKFKSLKKMSAIGSHLLSASIDHAPDLRNILF